MSHYQHNMIRGQVLDAGYLSHQVPMDRTVYQVQDVSPMLSQHVKREPYGMDYLEYFDNPRQQPPPPPPQQQPESRSYSWSNMTSHSLSPSFQNHNAELGALPMNSLPDSTQPEVAAPTDSDCSRKESDDESQRAERRRAQNRAAQRAYRQRKDQSLKKRELEIEILREELDKTQRLNRTLCKVVSVLRERLKEAPGGSGVNEY